jgi:hypothetical protein
MLPSTTLELLHLRYAQLARRDPSTISDDQRRSLRYYRTEVQMKSDTSWRDSPSDQVSRWNRRLMELEAFISAEQRWPRENNRRPRTGVCSHEQRLATWVRTERQRSTIERRTSYQLARLSCVPGHSWHPLEDRWGIRFEMYRNFTDTRRYAPSVRSEDSTERGLAQWAAKQRYLHRNGRLPQGRVRELLTLGIWTWGASPSALRTADIAGPSSPTGQNTIDSMAPSDASLTTTDLDS